MQGIDQRPNLLTWINSPGMDKYPYEQLVVKRDYLFIPKLRRLAAEVLE